MSLIWRSYDTYIYTYMIIIWYLKMCSVTWTWCFKMFHDPAPKRWLTASDGIWIWWPHVTPVTPWYQHFMTVTLSVMSVWCLKLTKLDMKYGAQHNHTHISNLQNACIAPTKWGFLAQNSAVLYSVVTFETCSEIAPVPWEHCLMAKQTADFSNDMISLCRFVMLCVNSWIRGKRSLKSSWVTPAGAICLVFPAD